MTRQFLVRCVPQLKTLSDSEVQLITTFTHGLPLLLQLVAGGLRQNRIAFMQFLNEQIHHLDEQQERESSVYAILMNWMWEVLSETERFILHAVSLFDPFMGCTEADLARVIPDQTTSALKPPLGHLVEMYILRLEGKDQKRYQLHPTLHVIIENQPQGELAPAISGMREAYLSYIVDILTSRSNDFSYLDRWRQDIVRMFKIALPASDAPERQSRALAVLNIACHYLDRRGFYGMVRQISLLALQHTNVDAEHPTQILSRLGQIALKQSDMAEAENYFKQARVLAQQEEHAEAYALSFRDLGILALRQRNFETASDYLDQAEEFAAEAGNEILWGQIKANLGVIAYSQGNYAEAAHLFQTIEEHLESTLSHKSYDYHDLIQFVQNTRGAIAIANEEYALARIYFDKALIAARELNNPERIARAYFNVGVVSYYMSDIGGAFSYFTQGAVIAEYMQHNELLAWAWWNQAALHIIQKEYDNARRLLQLALNRANDFSLKSIPAYVFIWSGISYFCQDKHKRSRAYYVKALNELNASAWTSALALYGISLIVRSNKDLGMTDDSETAYKQIAHVLKYLGLNAPQFKRIKAAEIRRAESYFQIALPYIPELWRYHIVNALLRWLE
jgi:tetratricopeptide (TPR) repeat protein